MLSYRHSYHAGNFADVLKHIVLVEILQHLLLKEKPFDYIETHAGAGLYSLDSEHAGKTSEYLNGVARLLDQTPPGLESYLKLIRAFNPDNRLTRYPGSPLIAGHFLRSYGKIRDRAWLHELHPTDFSLLERNMEQCRQVRVFREDGYAGLQKLLPPVSRRALILIDPSYELKSDYDAVISALESAYRKFSTGIYAVWYPVVERKRIDRMLQRLLSTGIGNIQRFESAISPDSRGRGMTASGMIVINPPWTLKEKMANCLPGLTKTLAQSGGSSLCEVVAAE